MTGFIRGPVSGGCPNCGNPDLEVPNDYTRDTIITCPKCKFSKRHEEFFKSPSE